LAGGGGTSSFWSALVFVVKPSAVITSKADKRLRRKITNLLK
jgi:hypothetical protein